MTFSRYLILVTHLVLTNKAYVMTDMEEDYFDINYEYYWLNIAKLAQALALMTVGAAIIMVVNLILLMVYCVIDKESK